MIFNILPFLRNPPVYLPNEILTRYVDALFEACGPLRRGDLITHETIAAILDVKKDCGHWHRCISRLKQRMEAEREISLWPENRFGYRLLTIQEQLTMLPAVRMKRASKQLRRAHASVSALSNGSLSSHQMALRAGQMRALKSGLESLALQAKIQAALDKPYEGLPKPEAVEPDVSGLPDDFASIEVMSLDFRSEIPDA